MASEYLKWLARDEKPEEKRELTRKEKMRNWWDYHKFHLLIAIFAVALAGKFIWDISDNWRNHPDYQIAYLGDYELPSQTVEQLEAALTAMGEDLNGDGQVIVRINQYMLDTVDDYYTNGYGAEVQLMGDSESFCFLLDDPESFQHKYGMLVYPDGTEPEEDDPVTDALWYAWADCSVLTGLELGTYQYQMLEDYATGDSQQLLSTLYIGRRNFGAKEVEYYDGYEAFWELLTAGAE